MMVSNFIDQHNRQWNVIALAIIFDDISVEAVRKIIRSSLLCQDKFYWIKEHTGTFSVKSSYKISQEHKTIINHGVNWSKLWKLKIHERLKILMWQIESNTIPTKQNLEVRLGSNNSLCPLCNEDVESNANLFFHCQFARAIWFGCCWGLRSLWLNVANNEDIIKLVINPPIQSSASSNVLEKVKIQTFIQIALILEAIWNFCNQVVHDDTKPKISSTIKNLEHKNMEHVDATTLQNAVQPKEIGRWKKRPHGTIKLNIDASLLGSKSTLAVIARDSNGEII